MSAFAQKIVRFRWIIIIGFVAIALIFGSQIPRSEIESDMKAMLPPDIESRINTDKIDELFGGTEMLIVIIKAEDVLNPETLKRTEDISQQMKRIKGVDKVLSLFELKNIKGEEGAMIVKPAVRRIPKTGEQTEVLRKEITENDIVYGSIVSEDFTLTAVIALLKTDVSDDFMVKEVRQLIEQNPGQEEVVIGGLPFTRFQVTRSIRGDLRRLLPLGLLIMLLFLFVCFKQLRGVVLPFAVVIMSILFSMGLIPLLGWKIHVISILLPIMLIAIANDYGIHLIAKYQEYNYEGNPYSKKELAMNIFNHLTKPVILTGLTTVAGMLCLLGHIIIPSRQLSVLASAGILFALAASLLFIPAVVSMLPKSKPVILLKSDKKPLLEKMLRLFGKIVTHRPKAIIAFALISALAVSVGIFFVIVDTDPNKYYPKDHPVTYAARLVNDNLGGAQNISVVFQGDIKEPRIMNKIDAMEDELKDMTEVGSTTSIARVVKQMSRALNDKEEEWYDRIPDNRNAVAQYFELYSMSGDPDDFEKMVDFPYEHALLTARLNTASTKKMNHVIDRLREKTEDDQDVLLIGGFGSILSELAHKIVNGQFLSLGLAIFVVGILLMILFRSVTAGLISAIPLALSIITLFGLMGIFRIELNIATALLSSIMIGVGVDYTIHFLWRFREERQNGLDPQDAAKKTLTTTGRGIVFNALSVIIGFVVLFTSSFMPVRFFGFLVVVSISSCLIGALILIPALCIVIKPKFLEPKVLKT
ncbi:MAG: MMPL family transporter [Candidatus Aminicenantes bacterium]|nr:MMPL family transporter [Candidatus Aminicenantes bacterium]MDH5743345.1 MMPL family transporter [Candidatus Aminicenantes bacterium]